MTFQPLMIRNVSNIGLIVVAFAISIGITVSQLPPATYVVPFILVLLSYYGFYRVRQHKITVGINALEIEFPGFNQRIPWVDIESASLEANQIVLELAARQILIPHRLFDSKPMWEAIEARLGQVTQEEDRPVPPSEPAPATIEALKTSLLNDDKLIIRYQMATRYILGPFMLVMFVFFANGLNIYTRNQSGLFALNLLLSIPAIIFFVVRLRRYKSVAVTPSKITAIWFNRSEVMAWQQVEKIEIFSASNSMRLTGPNQIMLIPLYAIGTDPELTHRFDLLLQAQIEKLRLKEGERSAFQLTRTYSRYL